jgi:hypothetical protein
MHRFVNCETGEVIDKPLTKEEEQQHARNREAIAEAAKAAQEKEAARAQILTKLGITEDEAKVLLG